MRRLYLQIYAAFVGILLLFAVLAAIAWHLFAPDPRVQRMVQGAAALVSEVLPAPGRPAADARAMLERLGARFDSDLALHLADGTLVAAAGGPLPAPDLSKSRSGWIHGRGAAPAFALRLADGRWLVARPTRRAHLPHGLGALGLLAAAIAVGSWPLARRITRRLERLRSGVEALGAGDLAARVEVRGSDEVAALAGSFNSAAARIENLVKSQRAVLAAASHELRSPLARIRMAIELQTGQNRPDLSERVAKEIAELDDLIGEILLASRLETLERPDEAEEVDLLGLLAEEAARIGVESEGEALRVQGDPRALRRMVRNLLENARRHGGGAAIEARVFRLPGGGARIEVADLGPGVPEAERERIFEPFHRLSGGGAGAAGKPGAAAAAAEEVRGSVGLGLALVRQIARHHGGEARCLGREGGGSLFQVDLPAAAAGRPW